MDILIFPCFHILDSCRRIRHEENTESLLLHAYNTQLSPNNAHIGSESAIDQLINASFMQTFSKNIRFPLLMINDFQFLYLGKFLKFRKNIITITILIFCIGQNNDRKVKFNKFLR